MGMKRHKPEEIVTELRQVEVLCGQGMPSADATRQVQTTEQTFHRWRKQRAFVRIGPRTMASAAWEPTKLKS